MAFSDGSVVENPPAVQEMQDTRVWSLGWENPLEEENGNLLQYSYKKNPMDRGAWWAVVQRVTKSWTRLSDDACMQRTHNSYTV